MYAIALRGKIKGAQQPHSHRGESGGASRPALTPDPDTDERPQRLQSEKAKHSGSWRDPRGGARAQGGEGPVKHTTGREAREGRLEIDACWCFYPPPSHRPILPGPPPSPPPPQAPRAAAPPQVSPGAFARASMQRTADTTNWTRHESILAPSSRCSRRPPLRATPCSTQGAPPHPTPPCGATSNASPQGRAPGGASAGQHSLCTPPSVTSSAAEAAGASGGWGLGAAAVYAAAARQAPHAAGMASSIDAH